MNSPSIFIDTASRTTRSGEVPNASFNNGMNAGGSCAPGIGIATDNAGLDESLPNWTLLDQDGDPRTPQVGQPIGGEALSDFANDYPLSGGVEGKGTLPIQVVTNSVAGDGNVTVDGNATLADLAVGWTAV